MNCPITGYPTTTKITLYKWRFYLIFISVKTYEIEVSNMGKSIYYQNYSLGWQVFDFLSYQLVKIPFIGALLIICLFSMIFIYGLPITALVDRLADLRILGLGGLKIGEKGEVIKNYNTITDDEDQNKNEDISKHLLTKYFKKRNKMLYAYIAIGVSILAAIIITEQI